MNTETEVWLRCKVAITQDGQPFEVVGRNGNGSEVRAQPDPKDVIDSPAKVNT